MKVTILKVTERTTKTGEKFNVYWGKVMKDDKDIYVTFKPKKTCKFFPKYCGEFEIDDTEIFSEDYKGKEYNYVWVSNFNKVGYQAK